MKLNLTVNGRSKEVDAEPRRLLADVLRTEFGAYGVHIGCAQGACGCCTVSVDGESRLSCLTFAAQCDGAEIQTIEGLGDKTRAHYLQRAFMAEHALQCGFCTPGFIMALAPFVDKAGDPSDAEIRDAMSGNMCRCTGYQSIVAAVRLAIELRDAERGAA
ncbi:(2Fe-2S)-binding protein [Defluviimonas sp. SAOS-178_SWC]|uniref:(2Fe-2S)-binding protein n=1 Tax=Defluviimonas sp. SAOS-178_SWC TaxID=3121287 RepID=UPI003221614B